MTPAGSPGRLLVLEHEADAPAGLLTSWAVGRGLAVDTIRPGHGDDLRVDVRAWRAIVVLGSEQTAFDDSLPWLAGEMALAGRAVAASVPVLGICFGAQVLARVLGAELYRLPEPEIGWVTLAPAGPAPGGAAAVMAAADTPLIPSGPWLAWHRDAFGLPPGARPVAHGGASLQAFTLGPHLGVQFHPEATGQIMESWMATAHPPVRFSTAAALRRGCAGHAAQAAASAHTLFSAWLDGRFAPAQAI